MTLHEIIEALGPLPAVSLARPGKAAKRAELIASAERMRDSLPARSTVQLAWGLTRPEWCAQIEALRALDGYGWREVRAACDELGDWTVDGRGVVTLASRAR